MSVCPSCQVCKEVLKQIASLRRDIQSLQRETIRSAVIPNKIRKFTRFGMYQTKVERLGLSDQVVELFNNGRTLRDIATTISTSENPVSHTAVQRFIQKQLNT